MTPPFYDTHAHLGYPDFAGELPQIVARAEAAGITKIITIGTDLETSERAIAIAEQFPQVYAAVGWHPTDALRAPEDIRPAFSKLARHPKVVAIGETGLDYFRPPEGDVGRYKAKQAQLFRQQLELACDLGLNCIIHQRSSFEDALEQMKPFESRTKGVFHCFSESLESMRRVFEAGFLISFTGILTFKNGTNVREAFAAAAPNRFMLETDCPFLAPVPYRGKRCEPAYVREIAGMGAEVRGCALEVLSVATCETAHQFFPKLLN